MRDRIPDFSPGDRPGRPFMGGMSAMACLAAALGLGGVKLPIARPMERPCLECGTMHTHANAWCSASCCKTWRAKRKGESAYGSAGLCG